MGYFSTVIGRRASASPVGSVRLKIDTKSSIEPTGSGTRSPVLRLLGNDRPISLAEAKQMASSATPGFSRMMSKFDFCDGH